MYLTIYKFYFKNVIEDLLRTLLHYECEQTTTQRGSEIVSVVMSIVFQPQTSTSIINRNKRINDHRLR